MFSLIDLYVAPPIIFTYRDTATVSPDLYYRFNGDKKVFTPSRPIMPNATYLFHEMHIACDVDELDYESAYLQVGDFPKVPEFQVYNPIDGSAPFFREPLQLARYLSSFQFKKSFIGKELIQNEVYSNLSTTYTKTEDTDNDGLVTTFSSNRLLGSFYGIIEQTAALVGKASITMTAYISAQEIADDEIVLREYMQKRRGV